jgi:hypothetical protein
VTDLWWQEWKKIFSKHEKIEGLSVHRLTLMDVRHPSV